jgi:translocation and assembly module TamA
MLIVAALPVTATAKSLIVTIEGIEGEELANVEKLLSIIQLTSDEDWSEQFSLQKAKPLADSVGDSTVQRLHKSAPQEIRTALQPFGYYLPTIESTLTKKADTWTAKYQINLGPPVLIRKITVDIVGATLTTQPILAAREEPLLRHGQRLLHEDYENTKASLLNRARNRGYLDATFTISKLLIDTSRKHADIELQLTVGQQYRFGSIQISQQVLNNDIIDQYFTFSEGDVFNTDKLIALQLALSDSNYFDQVEVSANREAANEGRIPVVVEVTPSRPRKYTYGIGYGTDTGPRTKLGIEFKRINKRGHKVYTELLLSSVKQAVTAQYEIPFGKTGGDTLRYISKYEQEDVADGEAKRFSLGMHFSDRWLGWQRRLYLDYLHEIFQFGSSEATVNFLIPGINLSYTKADNILLPHQGYSWFFDLHGGSDVLLSDTNFVQGRMVGQRVWSPSDYSRILAKFTYGATSVESFAALPTTERFFAGGDRSVRGYAYQSLAPDDEEGNTIGGRYLLASSLEADYLFYKDFGGALFYDLGDASNTTQFNLNRAVGIGFRWASPVGMFRIDVAKPLDDERNFRLHISIGADL